MKNHHTKALGYGLLIASLSLSFTACTKQINATNPTIKVANAAEIPQTWKIENFSKDYESVHKALQNQADENAIETF
jgi:hypothetical protein